MKVAIRLIFDYTINPFVDIVEVDERIWHSLSYVRMKDYVCNYFSKESLKDKITEISWIPIDGHEDYFQGNIHEKSKLAFEISTKHSFLKPFLEKDKRLSKEEVLVILDIVKKHFCIKTKQKPTVKDIVSLSEEDIIKTAKISKKTIQTLKETLKTFGLELKL